MSSPTIGVQSIRRAFSVLGALADGPLGVTEVAARSHIPKSTAARLLSALAAEGAVEQVPAGQILGTLPELGKFLSRWRCRIRDTHSRRAGRHDRESDQNKCTK